MKRPAVFLGRDGVINRYASSAELGPLASPMRPDEFGLLPGAGEAIAELNRLGIPVIVVSNQAGIANGRMTPSMLDAINEEMRIRLAWEGARLDAVLYCRHHPDAAIGQYREECDCRKPKPGLLYRAAKERGIDLGQSFLVGDGVADILAGLAAGVTTVLLSPDRTLPAGVSACGAAPDFCAADLKQAVTMISEMLSSPLRGSTAIARSEPEPDVAAFQDTGPRVFSSEQSTYSARYLSKAIEIAGKIEGEQIERAAILLRGVREGTGRLFLLTTDVDAGHTSHAAQDFRKLAGIEAYAIADRVSEPTAHFNGHPTSVPVNWLRAHGLSARDMILFFSGGEEGFGGNSGRNVISAVEYARERGASIAGIAGRKCGAEELVDVCIVIPVASSGTGAAPLGGLHALIWHLLASHPVLKGAQARWDSAKARGKLSVLRPVPVAGGPPAAS